MTKLRFVLIGTGFWARYQLAAWREVADTECVAVVDLDLGRAREFASRHGVARAYVSVDEALVHEEVDCVDVVTSPASHAAVVVSSLARRIPVICQKPLAQSLAEAERLVRASHESHTPLFVHENWRFQSTFRELSRTLRSGHIGEVFRANLAFNCSFPVFDKQPALKAQERFIIADVGVHLLDAARFLFGEMESVYCQITRVRADISGEDVATILLKAQSGAIVTCELSYASITAMERFPETFAFVEGSRGTVELLGDYRIRTTTAVGTWEAYHPPRAFPWLDPAYAVVQSSAVTCIEDLVAAIRGERTAETTADDNLKTLRLAYGAYASAASGNVIRVADAR